MLRPASTVLACTVLAAVAAGCADRNLYHYHRTVVGMDIAGNVSGNSPSGHLVLGYSRRLIVFLPPEVQKALEESQKLAAQKSRGTSEDTVPVEVPLPDSIFCTQVKASLGGISAFREILATGTPAKEYAEQLAAEADGLTDWKNRNFICPGFVMPAPAAPVARTPSSTATVPGNTQPTAAPRTQ
jgi:hypothetical protein